MMATDSVNCRFSYISSPFKWLLIFLVVLISFALQACASGRNPEVFHSFGFDLRKDNKGDAEVLDYQYGDCRGWGVALCAPRDQVAEGKTFPYHGAAGYLPRGESLYVKWRVKENGKVYEDRVDLTGRLPTFRDDYELHFVVQGPQLYVFLMPLPEGWPARGFKDPISERKAAEMRKSLIYPDNPKTYPFQIRK